METKLEKWNFKSPFLICHLFFNNLKEVSGLTKLIQIAFAGDVRTERITSLYEER